MRKPRFDSQTAVSPEIDTLEGTFRISVKGEDDEVVYENDKEPFTYHKVPSLVSALRNEGATLSDDHVQFMNEALAGSEETGKAVASLIQVYNDSLYQTAKSNAYQRVFNAHKPLTEENIGNAQASIVRNFIKLNNVSDETAVQTLQQFGVIPKEYTVAEFRGNRSKR